MVNGGQAVDINYKQTYIYIYMLYECIYVWIVAETMSIGLSIELQQKFNTFITSQHIMQELSAKSNLSRTFYT